MKFIEEGMIEVEISGAPPVNVDLWRANNQIYDLQQKHGADRSTAYADELVALVESWGLPKPSQRLALSITDAIADAVRVELGKGAPAQSPSGSPA